MFHIIITHISVKNTISKNKFDYFRAFYIHIYINTVGKNKLANVLLKVICVK